MRVCGKCGAPASPQARFCGGCGTPLPPVVVVPPPEPAFLEPAEAVSTLSFSGLVASRWRLVLPNGTALAIEGPMLVGRRPDAQAGPPRARLVTIDDPRRTVSRSHLVVAPIQGGVRATDVSGRSGIVVESVDGAERHVLSDSIELDAPCRIRLGAVRVLLRQD